MQKALALSAELIAELQAADVLLVSTPMYNFTIPAVLKSWIDCVVRPGYTLRLAPGWPACGRTREPS
jgi:FMN-dependent NADH-azoreductase